MDWSNVKIIVEIFYVVSLIFGLVYIKYGPTYDLKAQLKKLTPIYTSLILAIVLIVSNVESIVSDIEFIWVFLMVGTAVTCFSLFIESLPTIHAKKHFNPNT